MNSGAPEGKQFLLHKWHPSCYVTFQMRCVVYVLSFLSRHPPLNNINIRRHGWHTRTIQCWSFPWASLTIFPREFILSHSLELDISFEARWFFPVSPTNKADHHDIAEILLKVALNTITPICFMYPDCDNFKLLSLIDISPLTFYSHVGRYLHDLIVSLRGKVYFILTPPLLFHCRACTIP